MNFTIYKTDTGEVVQSGSCSDADYELQQVPAQCQIIPEACNPFTQYIKGGVVCDKPPQPNDDSVFDYTTESWVVDTESVASKARLRRSHLLVQSDWTQLPNSPLTPEAQQSWATYRQALRDITSQAGFPLDIEWPTFPN
jgi:hypothetical protein